MTKEEFDKGYMLGHYAKDCFCGRQGEARRAIDRHYAGMCLDNPVPQVDGMSPDDVRDYLDSQYATQSAFTERYAIAMERIAVALESKQPATSDTLDTVIKHMLPTLRLIARKVGADLPTNSALTDNLKTIDKHAEDVAKPVNGPLSVVESPYGFALYLKGTATGAVIPAKFMERSSTKTEFKTETGDIVGSFVANEITGWAIRQKVM